jgi:phage/plasmid-associated DNA primase
LPAALGIVHIAVMGRLFHTITAKHGVMSGMLLLYGEYGTGKSATIRFAERLHGHEMMVSAASTFPAVSVRMKLMGGLTAVCWDDFVKEKWNTEMSQIARATAGGADSVKMNNHGTYNAETSRRSRYRCGHQT